MRHNLGADPDVIEIAGLVGLDEFAVVGRLHAIWSWLDQHSEDGTNVRILSAFLDRLTACPGFADAMRTVKWLSGRDGNLTFPGYESHNGETAKRRALGSKRKTVFRKSADKCPAHTGTNVHENAEQRREEKSTSTTHTPRATNDESEVPDEPLAMAQAATAGVPEEFAKLVYSEWFEKQGHYRDGLIPFRRRLMGRWSRERAQWEAGTHSSQRKGKPNGQRTEADRERDRTGYEPDSKPLPRL